MITKVLLVILALTLGLLAATQVFAYVAHLDPVLGVPWYRQARLAVYAPWSIALWAWWWAGRVPQAFQLPLVVGLGSAGLTLWQTWPRTPHKVDEAHWATEEEWAAAECQSATGIVLGKQR